MSELSELLAEIVRHFQAGVGSGVSTSPTLPAHLDNLDLVHAEWVTVAGRDLSVHRYADGVGHEVAVYRDWRGSSHQKEQSSRAAVGGCSGQAQRRCSTPMSPSLRW